MDIKLKGLNDTQVKELVPNNLVLFAYRGSIAHGMYIPNNNPNSIDDKDVIGIYMGEPEHYLGFGRKEAYEKWIDVYDGVFYEYRKLISMLLKSNPNVLSLLWTDEKHIIYQNEIGRELRANRDLFVSKGIYHSFTGYAHSQFHKMTHLAFEGYMGDKRKQLVEKFGYDTKNAAHLIRLLKMGIEFLTDGELYVEREDASYLLAIKKGEYPLEHVKTEAERLFKVAEEAYVRSNLPKGPDRDTVETLMVETIRAYLGGRR